MYCTFPLLDTRDDKETTELVCPDPVFDPESVMYNISVMWNITNPLLSEAVGSYSRSSADITKTITDPHFASNSPTSLRPEVGTVNIALY